MENPQDFSYADLRNAFETEDARKRAAADGNMVELRSLYDPCTPELPDMNSPKKWDFFSQRGFDIPDRATKERVETVCSLLAPGDSALDYGCGYGYIVEEILARKLPVQYLGVDFSRGFVERLKQMYSTSDRLNVAFEWQSQGGRLPPGPFSVVMLLEVLEHMRPSVVVTFLKQISTLLVAGGRVIVTVPLHEDLSSMTGPCSHCGAISNVNGHVRSYTPELVRCEAALAGLKTDRTILVGQDRSRRHRLIRFVRAALHRPRGRPTNGVFVLSSVKDANTPLQVTK